jgi:hypothetical protein
MTDPEVNNPKSDPRTSHVERRDVLLWIGLLAGPIAWALHEQVSYMTAETACHSGTVIYQHLATLGTLLLALAGLLIAWRRLQRAPESSTEKGDPRASRIHFMALAGVTCSAWFALVILAAWIPNLILGPCQR